MAVLNDPVVLAANAFVPIARAPELPLAFLMLLTPIAILLSPILLLSILPAPIAIFELPVVFAASAEVPNATLLTPLVLLNKL